MALRAMYKGFKKVLAPLIINRPGELAIDQDALNTEINKTFFPRSEQSVTGAKNFNPYPIGTREVVDGSGNVSANANFYLSDYLDVSAMSKWIITTTGVTGGGSIRICEYNSSKVFVDREFPNLVQIDEGYKAVWTVPNNVKYIRLCYEDYTDKKVSNVMLLLGTETEYNFVPYAMTNHQLTDAVTLNNVEITNVNEGITLDATWSYAYQVGNIVVYAIRFTVGASAITENTILCSFGAECSKSMNADILPRQTGNHFLAALTADTTNHRTDFKTFGGATLTASNEYLVSGVYIAN